MVAALELKNVMSLTPAAALANIVLPVPGGPYNRTPFHGSRIPVKNSGTNKGRETALGDEINGILFVSAFQWSAGVPGTGMG